MLFSEKTTDHKGANKYNTNVTGHLSLPTTHILFPRKLFLSCINLMKKIRIVYGLAMSISVKQLDIMPLFATIMKG